MKNVHIQDHVFWERQKFSVTPCRQDMHVDVVIVGGGMAGLAAAQAWHKRGKKVIVLEQFYCGSGATGKSSGFITPNAELSFTDFMHRYNSEIAFSIWNFISQGVEDIRKNIIDLAFTCDYQPQDTMIVANDSKAIKQLAVEHDNLAKFGYQTQFYTQDSIQAQVGSQGYVGGVKYENTFGLNGYDYCQQMKTYLQSLGVLIFEETPVLSIDDHVVVTEHAKITADYIVVCTDRFTQNLGLLKQDVYHAQTFLMASQILSDTQIKNIFPADNLMCWDTDFIYQYFRVTGDNRLLVGGGDLVSTYASKTTYEYEAMTKKLTQYIAQKFPLVAVSFEYQWSGLMGISKDIAPIAGRDKDKPYIFYAAAATGLPIAASLGRYSADNLLDDNHEFETYFSPYRKFPISGVAQKILGDKLSFAISNLIKINVP